ncbi:MAG: hypothetical protein ACPIA7_06605, partial [Akkermansiaceae bacterium]
TAITDDSALVLGGFASLKSLKLNQTSISDSALPELQKLNQLEILNLHSTAVTDAGIKNLEPMSSLKKVYLWNTKVTEAAAKALEQSLTEKHQQAQQGLEEELQDKATPQVLLGSSIKKAAKPKAEDSKPADKPAAKK